MRIIDKLNQKPLESTTKSIFLAGPSYRENGIPGWREEAIALLEKKGFDGIVFSPEPMTTLPFEQGEEWEDKYLNMADVILFWVPRDLEKLPGFTTNIEFGDWMESGKIVLGYPEEAPKMRYLKRKCEKLTIPTAHTLESTIDKALGFLGNGALREGAEVFVPLHIWKQDGFQNWYGNLKTAGNSLEYAKVLWDFTMPIARKVFCWVIKVHVYIAAEDRVKENEFVFTRSDISSVLAYYKTGSLLDTEIVLVKEFRSPVSNTSGYVYELPGGSSMKEGVNPLEIAKDELEEETGLSVDLEGFKFETSRQICATLSSHKSFLFSRELDEEEIDKAHAEVGKVHGVEEDTERTYVVVRTVREILADNLLDWSMVGQILSVLNKEEN
jgi:8-oxo-dGTP pyrophosphatase MutT (NUDIX family)/nucleoside 2-deoxyribosyltransferase